MKMLTQEQIDEKIKVEEMKLAKVQANIKLLEKKKEKIKFNRPSCLFRACFDKQTGSHKFYLPLDGVRDGKYPLRLYIISTVNEKLAEKIDQVLKKIETPEVLNRLMELSTNPSTEVYNETE